MRKIQILALIVVFVCGMLSTNLYKIIASPQDPQTGYEGGCYSSTGIAYLNQPAVYDSSGWHTYVPANIFGVEQEIWKATKCFLEDTSVPLAKEQVADMKESSDRGWSGVKFESPPKVLTPEQTATVSKLYTLGVTAESPCLSARDQQILADAAAVVDQKYHNHDMSNKFGSYDFRMSAKDTSFGNRSIVDFADILRTTGIPYCSA